jgi:hypothetical protein
VKGVLSIELAVFLELELAFDVTPIFLGYIILLVAF